MKTVKQVVCEVRGHRRWRVVHFGGGSSWCGPCTRCGAPGGRYDSPIPKLKSERSALAEFASRLTRG